MISEVFDDIANERHLAPVLARAEAGERELPLEWLRRLVCGNASAGERELYEEHWLTSLLELLVRGGVGQLERRADDRVVFVFAVELPSAEQAWERAWAESA